MCGSCSGAFCPRVKDPSETYKNGTAGCGLREEVRGWGEALPSELGAWGVGARGCMERMGVRGGPSWCRGCWAFFPDGLRSAWDVDALEVECPGHLYEQQNKPKTLAGF